MDYIVLGSVKPGAGRRPRLAALNQYLKRDPAASGVVTTQELWASHPDYFMVISASAETEKAIWEELAPWRDVCDFKVIPVQPMREIVEMHLSSTAAIGGKDAPATQSPAPPPRPLVLASVDPPNPLKDLLQSILETDKHNQPWPEDGYAELSDQELAYLSIVRQLGAIEPNSGNLPSNAMERVHRPPSIPLAPWNEVYDHLVKELGYFEKVDNWFGDKGHTKEFMEHMNATNTETLQEIERQTAMLAAIGLSSSQSVTMTIEVMLDALAVAVTAVQPEAASLGIFLELAGEFVAKSGGDTSFTTDFGKVAEAVKEQFDHVDTLIEKSRTTLRSNWGKLMTFGDLVETGQLHWPSDTSVMRASATRAFETYLWQVVLPSLKNLYHWEYATYSQDVMSVPPFDPATDKYVYGNYSATTYQSGGCSSQAVQGFRNVTHQLGGLYVPVEYGYDHAEIIPLPNDFLYRLFGTQSRDGVSHPLGILPQVFFAGDDDPSNQWDNPNNPWMRIQLWRKGWQT